MPTLMDLVTNGTLWATAYHKLPCPTSGMAFWHVAIYKLDDIRYIVESNIVNGKIETIIKNFPNY